jgi:ribosomal protein L21E
MKKIGTSRRKSRHMLKKNVRTKGKISISKFMQTFNAGDKVSLKTEPAYQKGIFFHRFHGKTGIIQEKRGRCYVVKVSDLGAEKTVVVHPVHLVRLTK